MSKLLNESPFDGPGMDLEQDKPRFSPSKSFD